MRSDSRQAHVRPGLAAVGRLVDAVADRDAVARPRLAGADPDRLRVGRIDGDGADRLHRLLVEHRLERGAAVDRLPHAAAGGADVDASVLPPSCTAASAAMRPLIAAEPMLRAPRPEMVSESTFTGPLGAAARPVPGAAARRAGGRRRSELPARLGAERLGGHLGSVSAASAARRRRGCAAGSAGLGEAAVVDRDVGDDRVVDHLLLVRAALGARLDGERQVPAAHLLVVAERRSRTRARRRARCASSRS